MPKLPAFSSLTPSFPSKTQLEKTMMLADDFRKTQVFLDELLSLVKENYGILQEHDGISEKSFGFSAWLKPPALLPIDTTDRSSLLVFSTNFEEVEHFFNKFANACDIYLHQKIHKPPMFFKIGDEGNMTDVTGKFSENFSLLHEYLSMCSIVLENSTLRTRTSNRRSLRNHKV